ncbi:hypothetical protein L7F22_004403 [Adiantum nelumboides]|nr:hypothetical protein [Adiantum nelumboides]
MAQGRSSSALQQDCWRVRWELMNVYTAALLIILCCSWLPASSANVVHTVGGDGGWSIMTPFSTWLQGKSFNVGDSLLFKYEQGWHDLVEVTKEDYDSCNGVGPSAIKKWTDGTTTLPLDKPGERYFICSFIGHCPPMKLAINVVGGVAVSTNSSSTGEPSPSPSPPLSDTTPPTFAPKAHNPTWNPAPKSTPPNPGTTSSSPSSSPTPSTPIIEAPSTRSPPMHTHEPSSWSPMPGNHPHDHHAPWWSPDPTLETQSPMPGNHPRDHHAPWWSPNPNLETPSKAPTTWTPPSAWAPTTWTDEAPTWSPTNSPPSWTPTKAPSRIVEEPSSWMGPISLAPVEEPSSWINPPVEEPSSWITPPSSAPSTHHHVWAPTKAPTWSPTRAPTKSPVATPTKAPSSSKSPSRSPSKSPLSSPPAESPTEAPTSEDTELSPAGGPTTSASSFAYKHAPQYGAIFMTIIIALFAIKV